MDSHHLTLALSASNSKKYDKLHRQFTTFSSPNSQTNLNSSSNGEEITKYLSNLSPRQEATLEDQIVNEIHNITEPVLKTKLKKLGWVTSLKFASTSLSNANNTHDQEEGDNCRSITTVMPSIVLTLRLPSLLHPNLDELRNKLGKTIHREIVCTAIRKVLTGDDISQKEENDIMNIYNELKNDVRINIKIDMSNASKPIPFVREKADQDDVLKGLGPGLANVGHFLAVYSCKGGVGKSTIAANLAYELARVGARVGLLDVDVYGPSLPVLVQPDDPAVRKSPLGSGMVKPIEHEGVKMLSLGFVSPTSGVPGSGSSGGAAVMRGPMAGRVVTQLLKGTDWGSLDVLLLDMPPGTGDVQLTLCQDLQLSGAISITTPSKLAMTDAVKGVEMFTSMGVPTLAVVENMSYFKDEGGKKYFPFGKNIEESTDYLENDLGLKKSNIIQLPISSHTNSANEEGIPLCLSRPSEANEELSAFETLGFTVARELFLLHHGKSQEGGSEGVTQSTMILLGNETFDVANLHLAVDNKNREFSIRFFSDSGATEMKIPGDKLRSWHPKNGEEMEDVEEKESVVVTNMKSSGGGCGSHSVQQGPRLFPCNISKKGRYGYSVEWADGATIIYSMYSLARAGGGVLTSNGN